MDDASIEKFFTQLLEADSDSSPAIAAIETLLELVNRSKAATISGLQKEMNEAVSVLNRTDYSKTSVTSASELFMRFITLAALDQSEFEECKKVLSQRGTLYLKEAKKARQTIARRSLSFMRDGMNVLTHSNSKAVQKALITASEAGRKFTVFATESHPDRSGYEMQKALKSAGIDCIVVLDSAVGYVMEKINCVIVGAEGVMENGGIINKIGTFGVAVCAKTLNKPVYVMAETFKFVKKYPLNQGDIDDTFKYRYSTLRDKKDLSVEHPLVDYTPPAYISLIFTDLGVLTPTAVSDEIIKLYL